MLEALVRSLTGQWSGLAVVFVVVLTILMTFRRKKELPPGPTPLPFFGNIGLLRQGDKRQIFKKMREQYGDVFSFHLGSRLIVVISGYEALKEAFVRHAAVFSDRPHMFTVDMVGQGKGIVNASGVVWKEQRRFALAALKQFGFGKRSFEENIQAEIKALLKDLDQRVNVDFNPSDVLQTVISNIISTITFGERFEYDDRVLKQFLDIFDENMKLVGGTSILNFFPFLQYFPGDIFKFKLVLRNVEFVQVFIRRTVDKHIQEFDSSKIHDFVDAYLKEMHEEEENNPETTFNYDQLIKVIGDLFVGGTETTATTLKWALIFLVRNPDVQQRMYDEIREVVGRGRRPTMDDKEDLPYTEATILEIQRCADIAPFAVAHGTLQDVKFRDYFIPANSVIVPNVNSVMADPDLWENPDEFRPERFLNRNGNVSKPEQFIPFFMGRRVCPGEPVAKMELFLVLTSLIQRYDIRPPSSDVLPALAGVLGITHTPLPYTLRLVKRVARD